VSGYPTIILPQENFVSKIEIEALLSEVSVVLTRRATGNNDDIFNPQGLLRPSILKERDLDRMSMNMLGGYFEVEHTRFRAFGQARQEWLGDSVCLDNYEGCFECLENCCEIFFDCNDIVKQDIPYNRPADPAAQRELAALRNALNISVVDGSYELQGSTDVVHSPIKLNYWHVEFVVCDINGNYAERKNQYLKTFYKDVLQDIIMVSAKQAPSEYEPIPQKFYLKDGSIAPTDSPKL
jgi:hypothetical protein